MAFFGTSWPTALIRGAYLGSYELSTGEAGETGQFRLLSDPMLHLEIAPIAPETQPQACCRIRSYAFSRLQGAYIAGLRQSCKQKRPRRTVFNRFKTLGKPGAGEGIRTLDPNLGKRWEGLRRGPTSPDTTDFFSENR